MELTLRQLTEQTWFLPHDPDENAVQSCIGVITPQNESVLIDAGNSPRLARKLKTELLGFSRFDGESHPTHQPLPHSLRSGARRGRQPLGARQSE